MNAQITLSETRTAVAEPARSNFKPGMPIVVVFENGRRTPGQWYADTIAATTADRVSIDFGAGWTLSANETALLRGFAMGVVAAAKLAEDDEPKHTVRGQTSEDGWPYGTKHDMDCPACVASGTSFTASPRSETYWAS